MMTAGAFRPGGGLRTNSGVVDPRKSQQQAMVRQQLAKKYAMTRAGELRKKQAMMDYGRSRAPRKSF